MMYPELSEGLNKETDAAVYFYTPAFYPLDNFSAHAVTIWGKRFMTSEHAFQWKKFSETAPDIADKIFQAGSPDAVKRISIAEASKRSPNWEEQKLREIGRA